MPLEIRELHIRVNVNQPEQAAGPAAPAGEGNKQDEEKEAILSQCVEEVMEIINNKKER